MQIEFPHTCFSSSIPPSLWTVLPPALWPNWKLGIQTRLLPLRSCPIFVSHKSWWFSLCIVFMFIPPYVANALSLHPRHFSCGNHCPIPQWVSLLSDMPAPWSLSTPTLLLREWQIWSCDSSPLCFPFAPGSKTKFLAQKALHFLSAHWASSPLNLASSQQYCRQISLFF